MGNIIGFPEFLILQMYYWAEELKKKDIFFLTR